MQSELYAVIFEGFAPGQAPEVAIAQFAQLFKLDPAQAQNLLSTPNRQLKAGLDTQNADNFIARMHSIGIIIRKILVAGTAPNKPEIVSNPPVADTASEPQVVMAASQNNPEEASQKPAISPLDAPFVTSPEVAATHVFSTTEAEPLSTRTLPFLFSGRGSEYFKIWIVNLLLSIVTLGIYSAWAKVRNKQYFYGNTALDGVSFEYTAEPLKILKGRIIAVVLLGLYSAAYTFAPSLGFLALILLALAFPWILVASLRFNARHTSYRNIQFRFVGSVWGAVKAFILWPIGAIFSLGILFPFAWHRQTQYVTNNHCYGTMPLSFDASVKAFYKIFFIILGAGILFAIVAGSLVTKSIFAVFLGGGGELPKLTTIYSALLPLFLLYGVFYFGVWAFVVVSIANIQLNNTQVAQHRFVGRWFTPSYAFLLASNSLATLLSLGLFLPFAKVRTAAYKAKHTQIIVSGDLANIAAAEQEKSHALGEGVHDLFDLDIGF